MVSNLYASDFIKNLTPEEQSILNSIKHKDIRLSSIKSATNEDAPDRINSKLKVYTDSNRIIRVKMSVNDETIVKFCYKSSVMIEFGDSMSKLENVEISNDKIVQAKMLKGNKSIMIGLTESIEKLTGETGSGLGGNWETTMWVERSSDKQDYVFKLLPEKCPTSGLMPYPSKIIIEDREGNNTQEDRILLPTDYIVELTKGTPRLNNKNYIKVNGFTTKPNSLWHSLSISVGHKDPPTNIKQKGNDLFIKKPKFIFLDSNKQFLIKSRSEFLSTQSLLETNKELRPTSRFNIMIELSKKYIFEKKYIYMILQHEDENYHQFVKIPIKKLFEKHANKIEGKL